MTEARREWWGSYVLACRDAARTGRRWRVYRDPDDGHWHRRDSTTPIRVDADLLTHPQIVHALVAGPPHYTGPPEGKKSWLKW
jgi:hypothetical protein